MSAEDLKKEEIKNAAGTVIDIFSHRFVIDTANGKLLADFGKHNVGAVSLKSGDKVEISGKQKLSEIKIHHMTLNGSKVHLARKHDHKEKDKDQYGYSGKADNVELALLGAERERLSIVGKPRRKPEHFELLAKALSGELVELHVGFDGRVRLKKSVAVSDQKWAKEIARASQEEAMH